jgi:hypothetical protein
MFPIDRLRAALCRAGYSLEQVPLNAWLRQLASSGRVEDQATSAFFELQSADERSLPSGVESGAASALIGNELRSTPVDDALLDAIVLAGIATRKLLPPDTNRGQRT